jgi:hypothetical protein|tara:strand:- start:343 stop:894 length:552 start_codon:yes stop_codon:yes gene_type:complete
MKTYTQIQQELQEASKRSVSRQKKQYESGRSIAAISAYRGDRSKKENKEADKKLAKQIRASGHGYVRVHGTYPEEHDGERVVVKEPSYVIHSKGDDKKDHVKLKKLAKKLAAHHGQESVLVASKKHGSRLHGTKKKSWPGRGKSVDVGTMHPGKGGDFHTRMVQPKQRFSFQPEKKKDSDDGK